VLLALLAAGTMVTSRAPQAAEPEWKPLFNGRDLAGWTPKIRGEKLGDNYANTFRARTYAIVNLNLGYEFENGPMVFIDVRNVFDERYVSNFTPVVNWNTATTPGARNVFFPGDERSLFGGVSFTF
jgi:outer membrane receptor protein involved in Fe transport